MSFEAFIEGYKVFLDWGLQPLILLICLGIFITIMRKG